eukprot:3061608-Rhodomonas_salina.1
MAATAEDVTVAEGEGLVVWQQEAVPANVSHATEQHGLRSSAASPAGHAASDSEENVMDVTVVQGSQLQQATLRANDLVQNLLAGEPLGSRHGRSGEKYASAR